MKRKLIQWPEAKYWDKPWNPIIGCRPVSPACEHCYAKRVVERFNTTGICAPGFAPTETGRVNPPRKGVVFCGNMTDLFGDWVESPERFIIQTAKEFVAPGTPYLYLTKRVDNMLRALYDGAGPGSPMSKVRDLRKCNCCFHWHYFGFTAENQEWYDRRRDAAYDYWPTWANGWLSLEPLLGPIDDLKAGNILPCNCLKWCVVGCESGPGRRPCKMEWVESIVEQCLDYDVPVFVKQLDIGGKCVTDIDQFPEHLRIRQVPWKKEDEE